MTEEEKKVPKWPTTNWVWTINNPTEKDEEDVYAIMEECKYIVAAKEIGDEGTPHWQGYLILKNQQRLSAMKKKMPRAHFEHRRAKTHEEAANYCRKQGAYADKPNSVPWIEEGQIPTPKAGGEEEKARWKRIRTAAEEGKFDEIDDKVYVHLQGNIHAIHERALKKRKVESLPTLDHEWWYGEQESGKSRTVHELYPIKYKKTIDKWWDGYDGEEVVLIEDIDPRAVKTSEQIEHWLKTWGDHYGFPAQVKHGFIGEIRPKKIIVTSQYSIDELFNKRDAAAIKRRYKERLFVKKPQ